MALRAGDRLGPYEIVSALGAGGMGEVYRARDPRLGRDIAIKVLPAALSADPAFRERFDREARAIAALTHPHIVTIHSIEEHEGARFLTMELVEGRPLHELIPPGGLPLAEFLKLAIPLADAVSAAHQRGITHRDLKPGNVMVSHDGRLKVLDFGLAKLTEASPAVGMVTSAPTEQLTGEGRILGTAAYMSPEQAEGKTVDHRTDIFSLGIILYELATGRRPFQGDSTLSLLSSILRDAPPSVADVNVAYPREVGRIIRRCLEKDPARRLQSSLDLRNELEDLRNEVSSGAAPFMVPVVTAGAAVSATSTAPVSTAPVSASISTASSAPRSVPWGLAVAVIALTAAGGFWAWASRQAPSDQSAATSASPVTLTPFENRTGDGSLNFIGQMLADAINQELPQLLMLRSSSGAAPANAPARLRVSVAGAYYLVGETLRIQASLTDPHGTLLHAIEPAIGPRADSARVVDTAQDRILGAIAVFTDPTDVAGPLSRVPTYSVFRELVAGYALFGSDDAGAVKHFTRAAELDPSYFGSWEALAYSYSNLGYGGQEREAVNRATELRERLTPFEEARLNVLIHAANGRRVDELQALREAEKLVPSDLVVNFLIGQAEFLLNRPRAALEQFAKVRAESWDASVMGSFRYAALTGAHHRLGLHDEELRLTREHARLFPTRLSARNAELFALAALGRVDELGTAVDDLAAMQVSTGGTAGGSMRAAAEELATHGYRDAALAMARRGIAWYRARPPAQHAAQRLPLAQTLYVAEEWNEAGRIVTELLKENPQNLAQVALAGAVAARLGDRVAAMKHQATLAELDKEPNGNGALRRAQIAAVLGEKQQAVDLLRDAIARGQAFTLALHRNGDLNLLRGFAPYDELMKPKG